MSVLYYYWNIFRSEVRKKRSFCTSGFSWFFIQQKILEKETSHVLFDCCSRYSHALFENSIIYFKHVRLMQVLCDLDVLKSCQGSY